MSKATQKEMIVILILTLVFGTGAFLLAKTVDATIRTITETEYKIEELTRIASDTEVMAEQVNIMEKFSKILDDNIGGIEEIPNMLGQLENISSITDVDLTVKLEEGVIGEGEIEFKDEKEKQEFFKNLEVKEFSSEEEQVSEQTQDVTNVALLEQGETDEGSSEDLNINYLEIDLTCRGSYDDIRAFIELLQNSKYYFNVKELRMTKKEEGNIEGTLRIRAFMFEK